MRKKCKKIRILSVLLSSAFLLAACGSSKEDSRSGVGADKVSNSTSQKVSGVDEMNLTQTSNYPEDYKTEVEKSIHTYQTMDTAETVSYIFISDIHLGKPDNKYSIEELDEAVYRELYALVDVANNTDIDFVCVGGDIQDGTSGESDSKEVALDYLNKVSEILSNCNKPVLLLKGNHDDNSFSASSNPELLYNPDYIINNEEWYEATMAYFSQYTQSYQDGYFYYDLPDKNVRVVCLNMSDSDDTVVDGKRNEIGMYSYGYKDAQIDWLLNTAMAREDCEYVFLSHDAFDYPEGYSESSNRDTLEAIVNAASEHTVFQKGKFSKDFTSWTGKMELYHCGHLHQERTIVSEEAGGIPLLNTDIGRAISSFNPPQRWKDMQYEHMDGRKLNTINEALFDIVISGQKDVKFIRFGNGDDWSIEK